MNTSLSSSSSWSRRCRRRWPVLLALLLFVLIILSPEADAKRKKKKKKYAKSITSMSKYREILAYHEIISGKPVVVDFWSSSCGPCRQIAPHYEKLAKDLQGKAYFYKVQTDMAREISQAERIQALPTFHLLLFGRKRKVIKGADLPNLKDSVQRLISESEKKNVLVTFENLRAYYDDLAANEASAPKTDEDLQNILNKLLEPFGGKRHYDLAKTLLQKYGKELKLEEPTSPSDATEGRELLVDLRKKRKAQTAERNKKKKAATKKKKKEKKEKKKIDSNSNGRKGRSGLGSRIPIRRITQHGKTWENRFPLLSPFYFLVPRRYRRRH